MDAYSGYNQIKMHPADQEKTSFITSRGVYCYRVMPFGLKNVGATYQRLVNLMFQGQIGNTMEIYIDDMLVKSKRGEDHIGNPKMVFRTLQKFKLKLNPTKCIFSASAGKFLGFLVSQRGIEADPVQIRFVIEVRSPKTRKEIQCLNGRLAALNRFISKASNRCLPFLEP